MGVGRVGASRCQESFSVRLYEAVFLAAQEEKTPPQMKTKENHQFELVSMGGWGRRSI